jgi:imidazolonepropionase-like amidohydrolase
MASRFLFGVLLAIALVAPGFAQTQLALTHVNVIDVRHGTIQTNRTVLVVGSRIDAVEAGNHVRLPRHTTVIDARGKFLIPGLWDMHVHTLWDSDRPKVFLPLFLANGVTGVREMGGPMPAADQVRWRDQIATGQILGPRLIIAGPFVDGPHPVWPGSIQVSTEADGQHAVDDLKAKGLDFVKVYTGVPRAAYFGIAEEARKDNIPFVGHVPVWIGADEASNAGQKSIEHLMGVLLYISSKRAQIEDDLMKGIDVNSLNDELVDTYDTNKAASLFTLFKKNETWQVPTLTIRHARPYILELQTSDDPRLKYLPKSITDSWRSRNDARQPIAPAILAGRKRLFQKELEVVGAMHRAGVKVLAGTDTPNPYCFPGFSLHDELAFMVQAGFTPLEALQTATVNPVDFMGLSDSYGDVEKGKVADLVLLDANPLKNIANTRHIEAVLSQGRLFDRAALDRMLEDVASTVAAH